MQWVGVVWGVAGLREGTPGPCQGFGQDTIRTPVPTRCQKAVPHPAPGLMIRDAAGYDRAYAKGYDQAVAVGRQQRLPFTLAVPQALPSASTLSVTDSQRSRIANRDPLAPMPLAAPLIRVANPGRWLLSCRHAASFGPSTSAPCAPPLMPSAPPSLS